MNNIMDHDIKWFDLRSDTYIEVKDYEKDKTLAVKTMNTYQSKTVILQDETFEKIPAETGLIGITLTDYQRSAVRTMIALEKKRWINVRSSIGKIVIYYAAARVSEMVGSGKTFNILALILLNKYPAITKSVKSFDTIQRDSLYVGRTNLVQIKYKSQNILKPTLLYVGSSVLKQWISVIENHTELKYMAIYTKADFEQLLDMMSDDSVNEYDIIVVKNGHVGNGFSWPAEIDIMKKNKIKNPWTINVLANYTKKPWARVVLDDADTIGMPYNVTPIPCIFMWVISASNNTTHGMVGHNYQYNTARELLACQNYGYRNILNNQTIQSLLNVASTEDYIVHFNGLIPPKFYIAHHENADDKLISALDAFGAEDIAEIRELLNNDSYKQAAEKLKISSNSISDIFKAILGSNYHKYKQAETVLAFLETIPSDPKRRMPMKENPDPTEKYNKSNILNYERPLYNYPGLKGLLEETKAQYTKIYNECGKSVERMKDNFKHGTCPVCRTNLKDKKVEIFILGCCNTVYCAECTLIMLDLKKSDLEAKCKKCTADISLNKLIYVGDNVDKVEISGKYSLIINDDNKDEKEEFTKLANVITFCRNKPLTNLKEVTMDIPKLMNGYAINDTKPKYRKILLYAHVPKIAKEITKELDEYSIKYWTLMGDVNKIAKRARKFNAYTGNCILIIQNEKNYAGLNLQTATHALLYGVPYNSSILTQFLGRGQRIGRTCRFEIIFMTYDNEETYLEKNYNMKIVK